jgi:ankyrin repeat protein
MKIRKKIVLVILPYFICVSCYNQEKIVDKNKLLGNDIRLYQNTSAWNLAKAVDDEDIAKIKYEIIHNKVNVDFKEERFGHTLLSIAVRNGKYQSVKTLLELNADTNVADKYMGTSPVIYAAQNDNPKYLKIILAYKGNPNSAEAAPPVEGNTSRNTALCAAIKFKDDYSLMKVKMLVEAGADVNSDNHGLTNKPLTNAIMMDKYDVALYLLEQGADYKNLMYKMVDGEEVYILKALRKSIFDLNTVEYQQKLKVIDFLRSKGLNYANEPIPSWILNDIKEKYPNNWDEYRTKY